ncbi:hypothetical protein NLX69_21060 [Rossellomorea sp. BNER]|nr:hypothetical protein [Rossellomorea sp. BNER]
MNPEFLLPDLVVTYAKPFVLNIICFCMLNNWGGTLKTMGGVIPNGEKREENDE